MKQFKHETPRNWYKEEELPILDLYKKGVYRAATVGGYRDQAVIVHSLGVEVEPTAMKATLCDADGKVVADIPIMEIRDNDPIFPSRKTMYIPSDEKDMFKYSIAIRHNGREIERAPIFFSSENRVVAPVVFRTNRRKFWVDDDELFFEDSLGQSVDRDTKIEGNEIHHGALQKGYSVYLTSDEMNGSALYHTSGIFYGIRGERSVALELHFNLYDYIQKCQPNNWYEGFSVYREDVAETLTLFAKLAVLADDLDDTPLEADKNAEILSEPKEVDERLLYYPSYYRGVFSVVCVRVNKQDIRINAMLSYDVKEGFRQCGPALSYPSDAEILCSDHSYGLITLCEGARAMIEKVYPEVLDALPPPLGMIRREMGRALEEMYRDITK